MEKDTVGPKEPEKLPGYTYKDFPVNGDKSNSSQLIRLTISRVKYRQSFSLNQLYTIQEGETKGWIMDVKRRHGVIATLRDGQIEVQGYHGQVISVFPLTGFTSCGAVL